MPTIDEAVQSFLVGAQAISDSYMGESFPSLPKPTLELQKRAKYYRIVRDGSAHCFIDIATGDVLKPANAKRPAKHARGNVFDEHNGLKTMGPYGPAYLR